MDLRTLVRHLLKAEERYRSTPYHCSEHYPTVGYGQRIGPKGAPLSQYTFRLPKTIAIAWLMEHIDSLIGQLSRHPAISACWQACDDHRKAILISMAYQMGVEGLAKFENTLKSGSAKDWPAMADHALDSKWAEDTAARALRHARSLRDGVLYLNDGSQL